MLSETRIKQLAEGWLAIAGHLFHSSKDGEDYAKQLEGCFQNAMRQAAQESHANAHAKE